MFGDKQEAVRKDVECAFGILVQKFHILQRPLRNWYLDEMEELVKMCVIFHNMNVDERFGRATEDPDPKELPKSFPLFGKYPITPAEALAEGVDLFAARVGKFSVSMESQHLHFELKQDLVEHIWTKYRGS